MRVAVVLSLCLMVPVAASAAQPFSLDGYYVHEADNPEGRPKSPGDGYGVRVLVPFEGTGVRVHAEFQSVDIGSGDLSESRVGAGWMTEGDIRFGVVGEYLSFRFRFDTEQHGIHAPSPDGYGVHGRAEFRASEQITLHGQIGYVDLSDSGADTNGVEYLVGGVFHINPQWGVVVDYRYMDSEFHPEGGGKSDEALENFRAGLRFSFKI